MKIINLSEIKSLEQLVYKNLKITTDEGKIFKGAIVSYTRAGDSDDSLECIGMEMDGWIECFDITMIKSVEKIEIPQHGNVSK